MKLALTAGGTGGHILPAMAVLEALQARPGAVTEVRFFGPDDRGERARVEVHGIRFTSVPAAAVRGRGPLRLSRSLLRLAWGLAVALPKVALFRPDVVFSTGGYGSFPVSLAARLLFRPLVVYLPDVRPGWAVRAEQRLATRLATTTEAALAFLPRAKTQVTGYPVRGSFLEHTRETARAALALTPDERVVLIAGASQGARALNAAVFRGLRSLVEVATVFHVTGAEQYDDAAGFRSEIGENLAGRYRPAPFRDDLPVIMRAADLAVLRAGASTLGELPAAELPAILVPGTYAGGHQRDNARWLEEGGAAVVLEEEDLGQLADRVLDLLDDEQRLAAMREAAAGLARPHAADAIADLILAAARR
ncbi:MAG: UDP-N-acetylglucosamine--N-acetylmuramyl-(pentapeptide) pyrophosphoryl-undecaprenol N-acetylglucosamine transferase [Dehalococcoidia bacterium]|nr:UDP-N-acetylglucosamine--N-acetylmuramyl-(pentapeptide) pyrophosphoryl-undecaprenol N-acetylglucosamine transferase [Dehalococcoidia bacterium]